MLGGRGEGGLCRGPGGECVCLGSGGRGGASATASVPPTRLGTPAAEGSRAEGPRARGHGPAGSTWKSHHGATEPTRASAWPVRPRRFRVIRAGERARGDARGRNETR